MKLSFSVRGWWQEGWDELVSTATEMRFQGIEIYNVMRQNELVGKGGPFHKYNVVSTARELKKKGITVTAVCPFWTKTEFFNRSIDLEKDAVVKKYVAMYMPEQIVKRAWKDAKKGKEVSMYGFTARAQTFLAKILPHSFVMNYWMNQQKLK